MSDIPENKCVHIINTIWAVTGSDNCVSYLSMNPAGYFVPLSIDLLNSHELRAIAIHKELQEKNKASFSH